MGNFTEHSDSFDDFIRVGVVDTWVWAWFFG